MNAPEPSLSAAISPERPSRVGCVPNSPDFKHPADRRRYIMYFNRYGIHYEVADFATSYDAVYISISADLNLWSGYRAAQAALGKSPRVVFDLSDSYMTADPVSDRLRAVYHYLSRRTQTLTLSYKETLRRMIAGSDVVLCGSEEQKATLAPLHQNVVVMRDYFGQDIRARKNSLDLANKDELHLFWEGFSHGNLSIFRKLRDILRGCTQRRIHLHIVTDSTYCRLGTAHLCRPTYVVLEEVFAGSGIDFHLYDWNAATFSSIAAACDIALIPIPDDDPVMRNKPENKLLLLWSIGLPTITSPTPSYTRVMNSVGADDLICTTSDDWRRALLSFADSPQRRIQHMHAAGAYAQAHCSEDVLLEAWDRVFASGLHGIRKGTS